MGYFDEITGGNELIERTLTVHGRSIQTWWRPLTAGQKLTLMKGHMIPVRVRTGEAGEPVNSAPETMQVDIGESVERNQKLVHMTLCDAEGRAVYKRLADLQAEPAWLVEALTQLASEVSTEIDSGKH